MSTTGGASTAAASPEEVEARKQARADRLYEQAVAQQRRLREKAEREASAGATFSPDLAASRRTFKGASAGATGSEARGAELYERARAQQRRLQEKRAAAAEAERPQGKPKLIAKAKPPPGRKSSDVFDNLHRAAERRAAKIQAAKDAKEREHSFKPQTNKPRRGDGAAPRPKPGKGVSSSLYSQSYLDKRKRLEEEKARRELEGCTFSPLLVDNKKKSKGGRPATAPAATAPGAAGGAAGEGGAKPPKARKALFERLHGDAAKAQAKRDAQRLAREAEELANATFKPDLSLTADAAHAQFAAAARARTSGNIWHERLFEDAAKQADKRKADAEAAEAAGPTFKPDIGRLPSGASRAAAEGASSDLFDRLYQDGKTKVEARRVATDAAEPQPTWDTGLRDAAVSDRAPVTLPPGSSERNAALYDRLYREGKEKYKGPDRATPSWEGMLRDERAQEAAASKLERRRSAEAAMMAAGAPAPADAALAGRTDPATAEHYDSFYDRLYQEGKSKRASVSGGPRTPKWEGMLRDPSADALARPHTAGGSDAHPEFYERLYEDGKRKKALVGADVSEGPAWEKELRGAPTSSPPQAAAPAPSPAAARAAPPAPAAAPPAAAAPPFFSLGALAPLPLPSPPFPPLPPFLAAARSWRSLVMFTFFSLTKGKKVTPPVNGTSTSGTRTPSAVW
mmetsp:Transcript_2204/g.7301  ORF Transcript_2204/g.7301 Transcript_2204/m.7301 type:complete len:684 (-) Transcript_2204:1284-3335(-)